MQKYISVFSGIGGLEMSRQEPELFCDSDLHCQSILAARHPTVTLHDDISTLVNVPKADIVAGGWPCQDISIAGRQTGLSGKRSGLFFEMLRVATIAGASTIVGENVPNLLRLNQGNDFQSLLDTLRSAGYPYASWRILNARAFGLPQHRNRLFIVASKYKSAALALHSALPELRCDLPDSESMGFYWTAGRRSLCISKGFVPALKIGASDDRGRSPVAIFRNNEVRKLGVVECLRLQGFDYLAEANAPKAALLRMAGNAVPLPMGQFVMDSIANVSDFAGMRVGFGGVTAEGFFDDGITWSIENEQPYLVANIDDFLTDDGGPLSAQASAGLLVRSIRNEQRMPVELFETLLRRAQNKPDKIHPSRADSFESLKSLSDQIGPYRDFLTVESTTAIIN